MRAPIVITLAAGLLVVPALPVGAKADPPPNRVEVSGKTDIEPKVPPSTDGFPFGTIFSNFRSYFDPPDVVVARGGMVTFTNDSFAEHSWTVLKKACRHNIPNKRTLDDCTFGRDEAKYDSGVVAPSEETTVKLEGLQAGTYTVICTVQGHASEDDGRWEGMVGSVKVDPRRTR